MQTQKEKEYENKTSYCEMYGQWPASDIWPSGWGLGGSHSLSDIREYNRSHYSVLPKTDQEAESQ